MRLTKRVFAFVYFFLSVDILLAQVESSKDSTSQISEIQIVGKKLMVLPGSGTIIPTESIVKLNQTDINKVIRLVPGVNIRDEEGYGLRPNIGLRGTPVNRCSKITLMEDGILMAPAPYADPSAYYFPTFARMESLEVLKGSSQIKYGPYTVGGALNLVSTSIPESFAGFAQASFGSFNTNHQRIWVGDSHNDIDYVFEVNRLASNGFKKLESGGNTGFDRRDFMGKIRWTSKPSARTKQSVTVKFLNATEEGNESYLGLTYDDYMADPLRRYAVTQQDGLDLKHSHVSISHVASLMNEMSLTTTAYLTTTFRDWSRVHSVGGVGVFDVISNPQVYDSLFQIINGNHDGEVGFQSAERTYGSRGVQSFLNWDFDGDLVRNRLSAGVRVHQDEADRFATVSYYRMSDGHMNLYKPGIKGNSENQIRSAKSLAAFLHYEFGFKGLSILPGIRFEHIRLDFQNFGTSDYPRTGQDLRSAENTLSVWLPGIGFNYKAGQFSSVFGGLHKGFSPPGMPSLTSQYQATNESALNYEIGYRLRNNHIKFQMVGFWNRYANLLGSDNVSSGGQGTGNMYNAGRADVKGVEMYMEYDLKKVFAKESNWNVPLTLTYTFTDARFMETFIGSGGDWGSGVIVSNDNIPFITPHQFAGGVGLERSRIMINMIVRYVGETRVRPSQGAKVLPSRDNGLSEINALQGYTTIDLSGNYSFRDGFTAFATVNNLLNESRMVSNLPQGYRPGMPLSMVAGVKMVF